MPFLFSKVSKLISGKNDNVLLLEKFPSEIAKNKDNNYEIVHSSWNHQN